MCSSSCQQSRMSKLSSPHISFPRYVSEERPGVIAAQRQRTPPKPCTSSQLKPQTPWKRDKLSWLVLLLKMWASILLRDTFSLNIFMFLHGPGLVSKGQGSKNVYITNSLGSCRESLKIETPEKFRDVMNFLSLSWRHLVIFQHNEPPFLPSVQRDLINMYFLSFWRGRWVSISATPIQTP